MAKRKFRIEGGRYGGELVLGEVNPNFVRYYEDHESTEIVEAVLETDDWTEGEEEPADALQDPNTPPSPALPDQDFYMWECDELEHINSPYADGGFMVYEVPADGSDDWDYDKEVFDGDGIFLYGREGAYFGREEPTENKDEYIPVLCFHSSEKGSFGVWFVETDGEDFDEFKLAYGVVETNLAEFIDAVYYDKEELDTDYDYNDTTGKRYDADVGWLNKKWRDPAESYTKIDQEYWDDYNDNVEYEKENR